MKTSAAAFKRLASLVAEDNAPVGLVLVGRYRVEGRLGRGGMGEIFVAQDLRLNRTVALKVLSERLLEPAGRARFEAEARTMGRIDHPGVVPIHDFGELPDGRSFYVMKRVVGRTFEDVLSDRTDLPRLLRLLTQVCDVVQHALDHGVVHRDLKPANLMIGEHGEVYVLDWGLAAVVEGSRGDEDSDSPTSARLTSTGVVIGTPHYMPPEQAQGGAAAPDGRGDVYSLGAILYEILTGRPPIQGSTLRELREKARAGNIVRPRELSRRIAADLEAVCLKALSRAADRRYGSAGEFAQDLRRWLNGEPVAAYRSSMRYRLRKRIAKGGLTIGLLALVLVVVAAIGTYWTVLRSEAHAWTREARVRFEAGDFEEAKKLLDRAAARISVDPALYRDCERRLAERRLRAEGKRIEDEVIGPVLKRLAELPQTNEGWDRGLTLIDGAIRKYDKSWNAWMTKGMLHDNRKQYDAALAAYARAVELNPQLSIARYRRGRILMDIKADDEAAQAEFERALEVEPDNEYALLGRARVALLKGEYVRALKMCRDAEPIGKHLHDLYFVRGYVYANAGPELRDPAEAERSYSRAIQLNPENVTALFNRGNLRGRQGDYGAAIADYTRAIAVHPTYVRAYSHRGTARHRQGDDAGALADLDRALELDPRNKESYTHRGTVRLATGDAQGALADHTKAIEIDPRFTVAYNNRGNVRSSLNDLQGAIADYTRAIEHDPTFSKAYANRGRAHDQAGDSRAAMADWDRALELNPKNGDAYYYRGTSKQIRGDSAGALADLERAIALNPSSAAAYVSRADVRRTQGNPQAGLEDAAKALELSPRMAEAHSIRGALKRALGDLDGALADYTRAIELNPRLTLAHTSRGSVRFARGDFDGAVADHTRAIELDPRLAHAYTNRAIARLRKGDTAGGLEDVTRAIELDPKRPESFAVRGQVRASLGERKGAAADLARALELAPADWPQRASLEKCLRSLER